MAENSKIGWTTHTWNPWLGCDPVHAGCDNCYAQVYFKRWGIDGVRRKTSNSIWDKPKRWDKLASDAGERHRVFPSLMDPFEEFSGPIVNAKGERLYFERYLNKVVSPHPNLSIDDEYATLNDLRRDMFHVIDKTPNLDYLLLTKWPENIRDMWHRLRSVNDPLGPHADPRHNVHLLYSASDQETLEAGIDHLIECRRLTPVLGLSLEPLIGPVDLSQLLTPCEGCGNQGSLAWEGAEAGSSLCLDACTQHGDPGPLIDWVIVGGESDPNARPCDIEWILDIVQQCKAAGVACYVKQMGSNPLDWRGDPRTRWPAGKWFHVEPHIRLRDPKGADPEEWPEELRVQQYPEVKS